MSHLGITACPDHGQFFFYSPPSLLANDVGDKPAVVASSPKRTTVTKPTTD